MPTRRNPYAARSSARIEQAANIAGIAAAFTEAASLGPGVLALQQAVFEGIGRSQRSEATRIANLHGKDDERVAAALDRADTFDALREGVLEQAEVASRFVQTFQLDALFHGYVVGADGAPATGHTVRLAVSDATNQKRATRGSAKTDSTGYFRIDLKGDFVATDPTPTAGNNTINKMAERIAKALHAEANGDGGDDDQDDGDDKPAGVKAAAAATSTTAGTTAAGTTAAGTTATTGATVPTGPTGADTPRVASRVEVLDASGRVVFEDPQPPTFDVLKSEFRYYVMADKAASPDRNAKR